MYLYSTLKLAFLGLATTMMTVACGGEEPAVDTPPAADTAAVVNDTPEDPVEMPKVDHSAWDAILSANVSADGKVNYAGIKEDPTFQGYLDLLSANHPDETWSKEDGMSFWINAYNAFTVKLITDNYPLASIMDLDGGKVWDRSWIQIGDMTYTLGEIENKQLREGYGDARIHFAINCASFSCPPLLNKAFTPDNLEDELNNTTNAFLADAERNNFEDPANPKLSKIFEWYADDFTTDGTLIDYLNGFLTAPLAAGANVSYLEYNWNLNE